MLPALEADRLLLPAKAMRLLQVGRSRSPSQSRVCLATARPTLPAPVEDRWRGRLRMELACCLAEAWQALLAPWEPNARAWAKSSSKDSRTRALHYQI